MERWYAQFTLFNEIHAVGSSYVCRVRDNSRYEAVQERTLSEAGAIRVTRGCRCPWVAAWSPDGARDALAQDNGRFKYLVLGSVNVDFSGHREAGYSHSQEIEVSNRLLSRMG